MNTQEKVNAIFVLAGFKVLDILEVVNQYWPKVDPERYEGVKFICPPMTTEQALIRDYQLRVNNPWWLVTTEFGDILLGPRKRVYEIEWKKTMFRGVITEDYVTKSNTYVHAWGDAKLLEYLKSLFEEMSKTRLSGYEI